MVLALRGVLAVTNGWENARIAKGIVELLGRTDYPFRDSTIRKIVDELSAAGPNVFYLQAQQCLPILLALVRTAGDALTRDAVLNLVQRGEVYSRVAISALRMLYDEWPEHAASLGLSEAFGRAGLDPAAWYSAMRERFPDRRNFGVILAGQHKLLVEMCQINSRSPSDPSRFACCKPGVPQEGRDEHAICQSTNVTFHFTAANLTDRFQVSRCRRSAVVRLLLPADLSWCRDRRAGPGV